MTSRASTRACSEQPRCVFIVLLLLALALALAVGSAPRAAQAQAQAQAQASSIYALPSDPLVEQLIRESIAARPEIASSAAAVRAQRARIPQAGALPDPMLQLGIQNDGFGSIEIGKMESSYVSIMASQTFPWPGKRVLRAQIEQLGASRDEQAVERLRLSTDAEVRRLYLALLLARDRLTLLRRLTLLWEKSTQIARAVYEAGTGAQSDLLQAQLEIMRLRQRHITLVAQERTLVQGLNRLRTRPLDEPITTTVRLADLGPPAVFDEEAAAADALARSPELAAARVGVTATKRATALARKGIMPDLVVGAGVMPRGGGFPPMWLVSVGGTLPVYAGSKQNRAVEENDLRTLSAQATQASVEQILRLRVHERRTALMALAETIAVYRNGLLIQSAATAESALAQYQVGRLGFASVLDANAGVLADEDACLQAVAEAQRIAIAAYELNLEPMAAASGGGAAMASGSGAMSGGRGGASSASPMADAPFSDASAAATTGAAERPMSGM